MVDDDIICLSSDDESTTEKSPPKKSKVISEPPLKTEIPLPLCHEKDLKRKIPQKPLTICLKKPKIVSNGSISEISIVSPQKGATGESKSNPKNDESKQGAKIPKLLKNDDLEEISSKNLSHSTTRNIDGSKSSINPKIQDVPRKSSFSSNTHGLSNHNEISCKTGSNSMVSILRSKIENIANEVRNVYAKSNQFNHAKSSSSTTSKVGEKRKINYQEMPVSIGERIEIELNGAGKKSSKTTNGPSIREILDVTQISPENTKPKSGCLKSTNDTAPDKIIDEIQKSAEIGKSLENIETVKALSLESTTEKTPNMTERVLSKSDNIQATPKRSKSPEVEIVGTIETPKSSKGLASNKIANESEKFAPKSTNGESLKESSRKSNVNILKSSEISESGSSRSTSGKTSKREENDEGTNNSNPGSRETSREKMLHGINDQRVERTKIDGNCEGKSTTDKLKSSSPTSEIAKRRISLKMISELNNPSIKSDELALNISDDQDDDQKSFRSKNKPKSKNFEPTPGCSKTPDEKFPTMMEKTRKTTSPEFVLIEESWNRDNAQEEKKSAEGSRNGESHAGRSKSLDEQDHLEKPHLIVKAKEPVDQTQQDTFAMFLGLCLQTDRTAVMEKIVAKLKRRYEVMDPEYAKSREFINFLDDKRDRIMTRGKVYYWINQVMEEMRLRKKRGISSMSKKDDRKQDKTEENKEDDAKASDHENEENDEDPEESQRLKKKIKTIEKAMKQCAKRISELEVAEVDFDDENNSHFIKLERYKEKMVELYNKRCEYTNEHADAGRAYLRPKYLRFTQIPSIDQAINSFINSKLSYNRKKGMKGKSFVDGIIFPDYVDILECVGKVNETQNLGLNKRKQQQLAEEAFTKLGKRLQEARQRDYWDTFSLDLENSEDPATADSALLERLTKNQEIAQKKTKEIFEKYVRKQDERNAENHDDNTSSEADDDDDDDDDDDYDDEEDDNDDVRDVSESSRAIESDIEQPDDKENNDNDEKDDEDNYHESQSEDDHRSEKDEEDDDRKNEKDVESDDCRSEEDDEEGRPNILETIPEVPVPKSIRGGKVTNEVLELVIEDDKIQENNNIMKTKLDVQFNSSERESRKNSIQDEAIEIEANLADVDTDAVVEDAVTETMQETSTPPPQPPLRIRSFAKPPSSWLNSQEVVQIPVDTTNFPDTEQSDKSNTTITLNSRGSKVTQKLRISTSTTNPVNVRLQVIPTNGTRPVVKTKKLQMIRLPNGNCLGRSSNSQISGNSLLPMRSSIVTNQMRVRMSKAIRPSRSTQQVRPQISTIGNSRIINSSQAQIIRFSNGQSIRATSATFRPLEISPAQQRSSLNIVAASTSTKNLQNAPITINNPRFIKIPAAAVSRSPEMSQLRIERIDNSLEKCSTLSNNEIASGVTLPQIVSALQRTIPVAKPRTNENFPTTEQHKS